MTENEAIIELKAVTEEEFQTENQEEAYKLAIQALEKQTPKKPIQQATTEKTHYKCPCCNNIMQTIYLDGVAWGHIANYCEWCGQKIDCKLPSN